MSLFPNYGRWPITAVKGEGARLWDADGKMYLDFVMGIAVNNLGHQPEKVKAKLKEQLDQLWHCSNLFQIESQAQLAQKLVEISCMDAAFFCNSGAEANEAAIKLARRYAQKVLGVDRYEVITFEKSFHGRTLATLTATGQDKVKDGFLPLPEGFRHLPYNDIEALKGAVGMRTCAIMLELVQGEGGVYAAEPEWVKEIERLCEAYGLLLIVDEIQTGMGRTGKMFAYEHYGIEPDVITLAKGLGSGFPIGAMLAKQKTVGAFLAGSHGSTFGGNPLASTAGLATLEAMLEDDIPAKAAEAGSYLVAQLEAKLGNHPSVKSIRGKGLLVGMDCHQPVNEWITEAQAAGLLLLSAGPNVIRFLPPLNVTKDEIDEAITLLEQVFSNKTNPVTA